MNNNRCLFCHVLPPKFPRLTALFMVELLLAVCFNFLPGMSVAANFNLGQVDQALFTEDGKPGFNPIVNYQNRGANPHVFGISNFDAYAYSGLAVTNRGNVGIFLNSDQEVYISFEADSSSVSEDSGPIDVIVRVISSDGEPIQNPVSVDYQSSSITAKEGFHYKDVSGALAFEAGLPSGSAKSIQIQIQNNGVDEYDRSFELILSNPGGAELGEQNKHVVTIVDDDPAPNICIDDLQVWEQDLDQSNVVFKLKPSRVSGKEITVSYTTADGSAIAGKDYEMTTGTLLIPKWCREREISVPIIGGTEIEADETFYLILSDAQNCVLEKSEVKCMIFDDDRLDGDNDSMNDSWEEQIVDASPNDEIKSIHDVLPMDDFDNDAFSNLREFLGKSDPANSSAIPACLGDFDHDGDIDGNDLATIAGEYGRANCNAQLCRCDMDRNGEVMQLDIWFLAEDFGRTDCQSLCVIPSNKVGVFYYPWYRSYDTDGYWVHWNECYHCNPPGKISSDYYPLLGAYSSLDTEAVSQHFGWLQESKVGVIITSWWGPGSREDQAVPLLLEEAEKYGIKVAFHVEPHQGRSADTLISDINYLYNMYGTYPAFFRTNATTKWNENQQSKGVFFIWAIANRGYSDFLNGITIEPGYWKDAVDNIHCTNYEIGSTTFSGALLIANATEPKWIEQDHFDGLYNYIALELKENKGFSWSQSIPGNILYVPSVTAGFSAIRMSYPPPAFVPRENGNTYNNQWNSALSNFVKPFMVTITSFNEWHEGTQIEPAAFGAYDESGEGYLDYGGVLGPYGYLNLTREWVDKFLQWNWPKTCPVKLKVTTTSDWTWVKLIDGGVFLGPEGPLVTGETTCAQFDGEKFILCQALENASAGNTIEIEFDISLALIGAEEILSFEVGRGYIGSTTVEIVDKNEMNSVSFTWSGINEGSPQNVETFQIQVSDLNCSE